MKTKILKNLFLYLLFLSISFNITYWAMAKYDVTTDFSAVSDAKQYISMSKLNYEDVEPRFFNRFLVPSIVSVVDRSVNIDNILESLHYENSGAKSVQFNFGLVNIFFLTSTAFVFFYFCKANGFPDVESLLCCFLFYTSFFVITSFTAPLVDAAACFFIVSCLYALMKKRYLWLMVCFFLGMVTKESTIIILPAIMLDDRKIFSKTLLYCIPGIIAFLFIANMGKGLGGSNDLVTIFNISVLKANFAHAIHDYRLNRLLEITEVYMVLWIFFFYGLFRCRKPEFIRRQVYLILFFPVLQFIMGSAAAGRITFYTFPIVIPIAYLAIRDILALKNDS